MNFKEISLCCSRCGTSFTFSAEKQEFLHAWGLTHNKPRLCPSCALSEKSDLRITERLEGNPTRRFYKAKCADCGKNTEVPFKPHAGRRIFCSDCYQKVRSYRY